MFGTYLFKSDCIVTADTLFLGISGFLANHRPLGDLGNRAPWAPQLPTSSSTSQRSHMHTYLGSESVLTFTQTAAHMSKCVLCGIGHGNLKLRELCGPVCTEPDRLWGPSCCERLKHSKLVPNYKMSSVIKTIFHGISSVPWLAAAVSWHQLPDALLNKVSSFLTGSPDDVRDDEYEKIWSNSSRWAIAMAGTRRAYRQRCLMEDPESESE